MVILDSFHVNGFNSLRGVHACKHACTDMHAHARAHTHTHTHTHKHAYRLPGQFQETMPGLNI